MSPFKSLSSYHENGLLTRNFLATGCEERNFRPKKTNTVANKLLLFSYRPCWWNTLSERTGILCVQLISPSCGVCGWKGITGSSTTPLSPLMFFFIELCFLDLGSCKCFYSSFSNYILNELLSSWKAFFVIYPWGFFCNFIILSMKYSFLI